MAQMTSDAYTDALDDTVAQIICSVCRYFNLGKRRANDLLERIVTHSRDFSHGVN